MKNKKENIRPRPNEIPFLQQLAMLPQVVLRKFLGQMVAALAIVALTIVLLIHYKTWQFCIGFLMALYMAFLAMDIIWSYQKGTIVCRRMVCLKAQRIIRRKDRIFVIMRDEGSTEANNDNTRQFYIAASKKSVALITPQTVMDIYYKESNPYEVTAWEIVGNLGSG